MAESPEFTLQITENGHGSVVLLSGELDMTAADPFRECLEERSRETVTLDFTEVTFMDSTALGVLVAARKRTDAAGGTIILHGVQPPQMKLFEITGLRAYLNFNGDGVTT